MVASRETRFYSAVMLWLFRSIIRVYQCTLSPLLGLLGTVSGMIRTFNDITDQGVGNPQVLAGGISEALVSTAAGLIVAIPAVMGYRFLRTRVEHLVVQMEKEAMKLVQAIDSVHHDIQPAAAQRVAGEAG